MNEGELESFLSKQPHMSLQPSAEGIVVIEGEFGFSSVYHGLPQVNDSYFLRIEVPREFPRALPKVSEVGGRIPPHLDFHVSSNGTLCLGSDFSLMIRLQAEPNLSAYVSKCIVPYLYAMSLKLDHGIDFAFVFGELKHGPDGLVDDYAALFGLKNKSQVIAAIRCLLLKKRVANKKSCPCGCGKRLGKCRFNERVKRFRKIILRAWLRSYLAGKTVGNLMTDR